MDEWIELEDGSPEALIAHFAAKGWGDGLRVTVGTEEQIEAFLGVLRSIV